MMTLTQALPWRIWLASLVLCSATLLADSPPVPDEAAPVSAPAVTPASTAGDAAALARQGKRILVLQLRDQVDPVMEIVIRKAFAEARNDELVQAIVIDMNTPGGRLDNTKVIIDAIRSSRVPVYTFVNTEAISAGAIIALATKGIYMAPGSTIGCATPIMISQSGEVQEVGDDYNEKILSYTRSLVRTLAQTNGYLPELAEAFVDRDKEVIIGDRVVSAKGQLLTLTAIEAIEVIPPRTEPLLARAVVEDIEGLAKHLGLEGSAIVRLEPTDSERMARFLTMLSPLLLLIAMACGYIEIKTPGFGVPGTISLICFFLFLSANHVAGFSGALEPALIILGVILLLLELFVIPGFGVAGIAGLICLVVGIVLAMVPEMPGVPVLPGFPEWSATALQGYFQRAMINFLIAMVLCIAAVMVLSRYLALTPLFNRLVLTHSASVAEGFVGVDAAEHRLLLGQLGMALTDLRPAGTVLVGGKRVDVVSVADFIPKDSAIQVVEINGPRVAVGLAPQSPPASAPRAPTG